MTEIHTCGCTAEARKTEFYRSSLCYLFHRYPFIHGSAGWHTPRDRCGEYGRRYTVCHVRGLVHPDTGCPNAPTKISKAVQGTLTPWTATSGGYLICVDGVNWVREGL